MIKTTIIYKKGIRFCAPLKRLVVCSALSVGCLLLPAAAAESQKTKTFVFEEQRIEGKIRRPQLVLIKADQRPDFQPMAIRVFGKSGNLIDNLDKAIVEDSPYKGPFEVDGEEIVNKIP